MDDFHEKSDSNGYMGTNIYSYFTILVTVLVVVELLLCKVLKKNYITAQDAIASYGTAMINQPINLIVGFLVTVIYGWIWRNTDHPVIDFSFWSQALLFLMIDFIFYWFHRLGHRTNFFWAAHSLHHTGEEMNLATALRTSITQRLFSFLFYWPLLFIGFSPEMIYAVAGIHLIWAFWLHTRLIRTLGTVIEYIFNTPSHHRAHHGINPRYIDKNYGEFLIIWDRMFGTFEQETEEPVYGSLSPPRTWNPVKLNLQHWIYMKDAMKATVSWKEKIMLPLMPPEWIPTTIDAGFAKKLHKKNATWNDFKKFTTEIKPGVSAYLSFQVMTGFLYTMLAVSPQSGMNKFEVVTVSIFLWFMAINWAQILESRKNAIALEFLRLVVFAGIVLTGFTQYKTELLSINMAGMIGLMILRSRQGSLLNLMTKS